MKFQGVKSSVDVSTLTLDEMRWYRAKDVAKALGYSNSQQAIRTNVDDEDRATLEDLRMKGWHPDGGTLTGPQKQSIWINERGLKQLLTKSQTPNAVALVKQLGIEVRTRYLRKEIEIVGFIQEFLTSLMIPFEFQKTVRTYRVDLYLPQHRIAVEIDEHGHRNRNLEYEQARELYIVSKLNCRFLRINPDEEGFKLSHCLASVTKMIMETLP